jgi:hypothetical protein
VKYAIVVIGLIAAALIATYARYESLEPCVWLVHDAARQSQLPELAVEARIRADFLVRGIAKPGPCDCLSDWWRLRSENPPQTR